MKENQDVWKQFDQTKPSHSAVHHLMAIHALLQEHGYARGIDIAKYLNITRGSVSITLSKLKDAGYLIEDDNKFYRLPESGLDIVNTILTKRRTFESFLKMVLDVPNVTAITDACKVEHLLSQDTMHKMMSFMGLYLSDDEMAVTFRERFKEFSVLCHPEEDCVNCKQNCYFATDKKVNDRKAG